MILRIFTVVLFGLIPACSSPPTSMTRTYPQTILILRHAEKTGLPGDLHLNERGQQRAELLKLLFVRSDLRPEPFPKPDFIFAARNSKESHRPNETVAPFAKAYKLDVNDQYESKRLEQLNTGELSFLQLRDHLFSDQKYDGKVVLISWRHSNIADLASAFGANAPKKWDDGVFDRVWVLTFDRVGNVTFADKPQNLLAGDSKE